KWTFKNWVYTDIFCRGIPWVRLMRAMKDWTSQLNFSWSQRTACLAAAGCIASVPLAAASPAFAIVGLLALVIFLVPNFPLINRVRKTRGLVASLVVIPLHIIYALICVVSACAAFLYPPLKLPPQLPLVAKERNVSD